MNEKLFDSGISGDDADLLQAVRKRLREMDVIDGGLMRLPLAVHLRTAITALVTALGTRNWVTAAEALAMLQDAELRARRPEPRPPAPPRQVPQDGDCVELEPGVWDFTTRRKPKGKKP